MRAIVFVLSLLMCGTAIAVESQITVQGSGSVSVAPDEARVVLGIVSLDSVDIKELVAENSKLGAKMYSDLSAMGIKADKVSTIDYSISPEYVTDKEGKTTFTGYRIENSFSVCIDDLSKVPDVLNLSNIEGAKFSKLTLSHLTFGVKNRERYMTQARKAAMKDAYDKAASMLEQVNAKVGRVVNVSETRSSPAPYAMMREAAPGSSDAPVSGGSKEISAGVNVVFRIDYPNGLTSGRVSDDE